MFLSRLNEINGSCENILPVSLSFPFTPTYDPHSLAAKNIILKKFKLLQNDNETGRIFLTVWYRTGCL